ncbi:AzlD domain-containing protein [Marinitenerispora sediminis]|uniref:Branched-chain amino acid transporter AzlD n=1 Tax=Marinitenerispora sediminis TaxID=1931232 RepID=A0A368T541_9ACTN|nr:AzlD domain-containing protein [Marinitenerispora sediminis]RCV54513.1 branched-chain amino acid transporter AzlD [Marinitenerispora sediminis]RCV58719.1 branched-chain amino acid transporter AzlD [Marinitenerispora sediminis]RCV61377.1 branched-chain amino acid transporter AzlD [Marinitenerispora sediminis]
MTLWIAILLTGIGCYLLKYAGLSAPRRLLDHPLVNRFAMTVPVALLAALIALQAIADGRDLVLDVPKLAGLATAVVALLLRAPFLVVILAAAATAAGLRLLGVG